MKIHIKDTVYSVVEAGATLPLYFYAAFGSRWLGKKLRLLVLEEELFSNGAHGAALRAAYGQGEPAARKDPLWVFRQHGWFKANRSPGEVVPPFLMELRANWSQGVLLSAELEPGRQMPKAEKDTGVQFTGFRFPSRAPDKFSAEDPKSFQREKGRISFRVNLDDFETDATGTIVPLAPKPGHEVALLEARSGPSTLVIVLVNAETTPFAGEQGEQYYERSIVFSSLWRIPGDVTSRTDPRLDAFPHLANVSVRFKGVKPPAPSTPPPGGGGGSSSKTDLTGTYECYLTGAARDRAEDPALILQVNWAAGGVAGWFTWPPRGSTEKTDASLPPLEHQRPGCFAADAGSQLLRWAQPLGLEPPRDDPWSQDLGWEPKRQNRWDPDDLFLGREMPPNADFTAETGLNGGIGAFVVEGGSPMRLNVLFKKGAEQVALFCERTSLRPRLTRSRIESLIIDEQSPSKYGYRLHSIALGEHVLPIPRAFWMRIEEFITAPPTEPFGPIARGEKPPVVLADAIRRWKEATTNGLRSAAEQAAGELLRKTIFAPYGISLAVMRTFHRTQPHPHYPLLRAHFVGLACRHTLRLGDESFTLYGWLQEIVKDQVERALASGLSHDKLMGSVDDGFKLVGIDTAGNFTYRITFEPYGVQREWGVGFGAYFVMATITKYLTKGDSPKPHNRVEAFGEVVMYGGFLDVSYGLQASIGWEIAKSPAASAGGGGASSAPSGAVDFLSFHDVPADDFQAAWLVCTGADGPGAGGGAGGFGLSYKAVGGLILSVTVPREGKGDANDPGDLHLVAEVVQTNEAGGSVPSRVDQLSASVSASVGLISANIGGAYLTRVKHKPGPKPKPSILEAKIDVSRKVQSGFSLLFPRNQSTLTPEQKKIALRALAAERGVLISKGGWIQIRGHASPDGTAEENLSVSRGRANALEALLREAYGDDLKGVTIEVEGHGERLAIEDGLVDPEQPPSPDPQVQAERERRYREQEELRKEYRRVDLVLNGEMTIQMTGEEMRNPKIGGEPLKP